MKGQGFLEYALILVLVAVVVIVILALTAGTTTYANVVILDKQAVPTGIASSDLNIIGLSNNGVKIIFTARNSVIYSSVDVGATCTFETQPAGWHNEYVQIQKAICQGAK